MNLKSNTPSFQIPGPWQGSLPPQHFLRHRHLDISHLKQHGAAPGAATDPCLQLAILGCNGGAPSQRGKKVRDETLDGNLNTWAIFLFFYTSLELQQVWKTCGHEGQTISAATMATGFLHRWGRVSNWQKIELIFLPFTTLPQEHAKLTLNLTRNLF